MILNRELNRRVLFKVGGATALTATATVTSGIAAASPASSAEATAKRYPRGQELFIGSYTSGSNHGLGVSAVEIGEAGKLGTSRIVASLADPSFVVTSGSRGYAVLESAQGRVAAFDLCPQTPSAKIQQSQVFGADPAHLAYLPQGRLVVANYTSGSVVLLATGDALSGPTVLDTLQLQGSGPVAGRQDGPHAHQVVPTGYGTVLVSDLGSDTVTEIEVTESSLKAHSVLRVPAGTGPRHLVLRRSETADEILVVGELDTRVHLFRRPRREAPGGWEYAGAVVLASTTGEGYSAHLVVNGNLAYVSIRGQNQMSVLQLAEPQENAGGALPQLIQEVPSGGDWPRHFALNQFNGTEAVLYVAHQRSDNIAVFRVDETGLIGEQIQDFAAGTPVCLVVH
ncbi:lactonase family protein [Psychromicrobium sp. YIM B11713]|uniref:lactonase family protein n=1 Tax=Psychromicrobium sp. YIM B11713 TaxID=3145233 RepID=UPI00374F0ED2